MSVIPSVTFDKYPSSKGQFLIDCSSGFELSLHFVINTENKSAINSFNKLETGKKKILCRFAITVLSSSSTYCKPGSVASVLLLASVVKSNKQFLPQKLK